MGESENGRDSAPAAGERPVLNYASPGTGVRLVTIATFGHAWEAHLAVGKLESEGIRAVLADENVVSASGGIYNNAIGGVKLQVAQQDVPQALAVLPERVRGRIVVCPKCGLTDTRPMELSPGMKMLCLCLLGLPYLFFTRPWVCIDCGHLFKSPPPAPRRDENNEDDDDDD
jgi:hypothetical protein